MSGPIKPVPHMKAAKPNAAALSAAMREAETQKSSTSGCLLTFLAIVMCLVILGGGGYFLVYKYRPQWLGIAPEKALEEAPTVARPKPQKPETNVVVQVEVPKPKEPEKPVVTPAMLRAEAMKQRAEMAARVEQARQDTQAKPLKGIGGVKFGAVLPGTPLVQGPILEGTNTAACGESFAVEAPPNTKTFLSFANPPRVWLTPKTRRAWKIEFVRALKPKSPEGKEDTGFADTVAALQKRFGSPITGPAGNYVNAGSEAIFPRGDTSVRVVQYGARLELIAIDARLRDEAKVESDALRAQRQKDLSGDKRLDSDKYPTGISMKPKGFKSKAGTPRAFCGIAFGTTAPEGAVLSNPVSGAKGFYVDYRLTKCKPFRNFCYGRADTDPYRGGVYAITLYSAGGEEGLDDAEYAQNIAATISAHYKAQPQTRTTRAGATEHVWQLGDLEIVLSPEARGGYRLRACHKGLDAWSRVPPKDAKKGRN